jgi:hypothetical protein
MERAAAAAHSALSAVSCNNRGRAHRLVAERVALVGVALEERDLADLLLEGARVLENVQAVYASR